MTVEFKNIYDYNFSYSWNDSTITIPRIGESVILDDIKYKVVNITWINHDYVEISVKII